LKETELEIKEICFFVLALMDISIAIMGIHERDK
jgi:hypothetical protein